MKIRLLVLISGKGSSLRNLILCQNSGLLDAEIIGVISSLPRCDKNKEILEFCALHKISTNIVSPGNFKDTLEFWEAQNDIVDFYRPDLIVLAGYLRLWKIPEKYFGRVMNIHPALLPKFGGKGYYGIRVHEAVIASDEEESGCTVHFINSSNKNPGSRVNPAPIRVLLFKNCLLSIA